VRELSDLISLCAQLHAGRDGDRDPDLVRALWLASVTVTAAGSANGHESGKSSLRSGDPAATLSLWRGARETATRAGLGERLERAAEAIGFQPR
jgi:hypothetical protein